MTKARRPISSAQAMTRIAGALDISAMVEITGRSPRTHYEWADPDTNVGPSLKQAITLDLAYNARTGDGHPFHEYYSLALQLAEEPIERSLVELLTAAGDASKESGEAIDALLAAALPNATLAEVSIAVKEIEESIAAHTTLLRTLIQHRPELRPPAPG